MRPFFKWFLCAAVLLFFEKKISSQCAVSVSAGDDIYLCAPPTPTQLNGSITGDFLNFTWSPTVGMSGANTLNPTVNVTQTSNFVLTVRAADMSNNLIQNGDFSAGNSGFNTQYQYSPGNLVPEGVYDVLANPQSAHPGFAPCEDHTGGGNMMAVNGSSIPNTQVWCQTVPVTPNTQYVFSAWVASLVSSSPAILQFSINGAPFGPITNAPSQTCNWVNFFAIWNSGGNTTADICVVNLNLAPGGNDFALDDIVFAPVCEVRDTVTVHVVSVTAVASPPVTAIPCNGSPITLNGTGSSAGPNISYEWTTPNGSIVSGANTLSPVVNAAGVYTLTVYHAAGGVVCERSASVNVIEHPNPFAAWISPPPPLGCGLPTVTLVGNSNQPGFSSYQWTAGPGANIVSGSNNKNCVIDAPGEYFLLVTNTMTGCTAEASVIVTQATDPPTAIAQVAGQITCLQTQADLSGIGSSQGPHISYLWTALGGGVILSGQNNLQATAGAAGTYVLTVSNSANGCSATDTVSVVGNIALPLISLDSMQMLNCAIDSVTLAAFIQPLDAAFVWMSNNGVPTAGWQTLQPRTGQPGIYTLIARHPISGCRDSATIVVTQDLTPPAVTIAAPDTLTCFHTQVVIDGSGSSQGPQFGYQWSAPAGNIISGAQNPQVTVNAPGIYTLTVRDSVNYCVASDSVHVLANDDVITAIAYATDTLNCAVSSVALHSEGSAQGQDISYLWTTANGLILSGADGPSPLVGAPGVYTLLLTNTATGCTSTDTVHVQSNYTTLSLHIPAPEPLTCSSPSQTVVAQFQPVNAPYSFSWSTPDGNILNGQNEPQITVDAPGMYIATATHLLSHCAVSDTALVGLEVGTPVAAASALGQLSCVQTAVVLDASASSNGPEFAYVWAGQTPIEGDSTLIAVVNAPGVYSLTVWNTLTGCSATISLTVASDTMPPTADAGPDRTLTCFAPQQTLSAGSMATGLSYVWTAPDQSQTAGPQIIANTPGAYVLTAQNPANGCSAADTAWVDANQAPPALLALTPLPLTCASPSTPLVLQGDAQHLTLSWSTPDGLILSGANTSEPVVGAPGTYSLTATDTLNGCSQTLQTLVAQDTAPPLLSVAPPAMLTCAQTQQVLAAQNGASGVFEYVWTGPDGQQAGNALQILASEPGVYVLQAMNVANGCAASAQVVLLQDTDPPVVDAGPDQTLNCSMTQLTLQGAATGSGSLSFAWSTPDGWILSGADTPNPIIAAPGEYVLLVTQTTNGCTASAIAQVSRDDDQPLVQILPAGTLTCAITQLTLTGLADNGPSIAYQWSTPDGLILAGAQSLSAVVGAPGVYTLLASNSENGCTNSQSATIIADTIAPALYISEPDTLTCAVQMVQIDAAVSGDSLIYQWTGAGIVSGAGTSKPTVSQPGVYTLTALNPLNGCTSVFDVAVAADQNPPILQAQTPPALTCDQPQATLQIQTQPTGLPYAYAWSTSNGLILSGAQSPSPQVGAGGLYFVSVQNLQNGCTATLDLSVESDQTPPTALIAPPAPITCLVTSATLDASASTPGASYWWTAGGGGQIAGPSDQPTAEVVSAGIYTLTLTQLSNGCTAQSFVQVQADQNPPIVSIAPPEVLNCLTSSVALQASAQATGPLSYAWATPNGLIDGDPQSPTAQVSGPGDYYLTVVNSANGCSASAMVVVQRDITPPLAKAGPDGVLHCKQTEWTLKGESDAGPRAFLWTAPDGQTFGSPQINITAPGAYTLLVTNTLNGCTATSVASIAYVPPPQFTPTLWQPDCLYPYGDIDFGAIGGGQPPFAYSWNGGASFGPVSSVEKLPPGAYDLIVRDAYGCTAAAEAVFVLPDPLLLSIVAPQTIDLGDSIRLSAISNRPVAQWTWTSAEPLSCTDCPAPWAAPQRSATYQAQAADASGCTAEVSVLLRVNRRRRIYAPNVFAPEIQGLNTRFTLFGKGVESIESLQIYDRWGSQIYAVQGLAINDPTQGWDGTYRGQTLSPGVYVWIARIRFADDETETLSGDVTLLR